MTEKINLLITGGAGFIGSNLVEYFINDDRVALVRVLDDLSNGSYKNIQEFEGNPKFEFIEGDICNYDTCLKACEGIDRISHQAALGSVPRSIQNPVRTNEVNIGGTVNILYAAKETKVERVILAFSSSTYGDHSGLPKVEGIEGNPLSPYAVTKAAIEQYAEVFGKIYNLKWLGLRYFNVFGPKQNPDNPYAAVIPIFCKAIIKNQAIKINGDGKTSRDFTYVENIVMLNDLCLFTKNDLAFNQVYNAACGENISLLDMVRVLEELSNKKAEVIYCPSRPGDVKHSLASITKSRKLLGYKPKVKFIDGIEKAFLWYKEHDKALDINK